jgi:two-component sensor histidine kinase
MFPDLTVNRNQTVERLGAWLPPTGGIEAYIVASIVAVGGVIAHFGLDRIAHASLPPYITLYPVIVVSAFAGGMRVGVYAVVLSALASWFFWIGPQAGLPASAARITIAIIYIINAVIVVLACGFARLLLDQVLAEHAERERSTRESVHRIKNLIAVVQSLSRRIGASAESVESYRQRLDARLSALGVAQDMLLKRDGQAVNLHELAQATLGPFLDNTDGLEISIAGDIPIPPRAAGPVSLALYELATNSTKYGALASSNGFVRLEGRQDEGRCYLDWRETGLAKTAGEETTGLGSLLIRSALNSVDEGLVRYEIGTQGVNCVFEWPAPQISA